MTRGGSLLLGITVGMIVGFIVFVSVPSHAHTPKPVPCEPTLVQAAQVWTVRLIRADGKRGRVQVDGEDVFAAAQAGQAAGGGAKVTDVWEETHTLGEVVWE